MNPYDFVSIDWNKPPVLEKPIWHYQLVAAGQQKLYSGRIDIAIQAETPLFIRDPKSKNTPMLSLRNLRGEYIIPGSSLKGMLRNVVETLGRGCLTLFDGNYEKDKRSGTYKATYQNLVPRSFLHCTNNNELCLSCRIFGMIGPKDTEKNTVGKNMFLGKVNIGDACAIRTSPLYKKMYTVDLMGPQPHHDDFYLDGTRQHIAGRKYYFHHTTEPLSASKKTNYNSYIQPLDTGTTLKASLDFAGLTTDEFSALLFALMLEDGMRHKIGYAKPLGLGSIHITLEHMTLIDYAARYTKSGESGQTEYTPEAITQLYNELSDTFKKIYLVQRSLQDLRRIWRWPAASNVIYDYPGYAWFENSENRGKRIAHTP